MPARQQAATAKRKALLNKHRVLLANDELLALAWATYEDKAWEDIKRREDIDDYTESGYAAMEKFFEVARCDHFPQWKALYDQFKASERALLKDSTLAKAA